MRKRIKFNWYQLIMKRLIDIVLSGITLIMLSPLFLLLYLLVGVIIGRPVLFCQDRPGKNGEIFKLYKFRTMNNKRDDQGKLLSDDVRLTPFGRFLRTTSLDELPELWNVFIGDMSLVGPRPLLVKYLPLYTTEQQKRHLVKPGLTGLAQVSGRNLLSWEEKLKLDVHYVTHLSFFHDIKVICLTVVKLITREGISAQGHATMQEFKGNEKES
ncbi:sugar transferase [Enterococcus ureasiticus]|uniref:Bacterial sugar transferase domain-containing protein n=1 Tax=Enterococcus ureasiticus TaxID=903984 RepID=A0A1E5GGV7_9ENTE|nr:sugar transferase [Enterococcus ureasiticus]OEG11956.1 hypothetical protein BCR21_06890 [Enterococcus ureasiticus]